MLILTGCGKFTASNPAIIDLEILPYVDQYKVDKKIYTGNSSIRKIDIGFVTSHTHAAVCYIQDRYRKIEIDPEYWFSSDDSVRTIVLYHELGHCDLNRLKHSGIVSIMNANGMDENVFNLNRAYYLNLLFKEGK